MVGDVQHNLATLAGMICNQRHGSLRSGSGVQIGRSYGAGHRDAGPRRRNVRKKEGYLSGRSCDGGKRSLGGVFEEVMLSFVGCRAIKESGFEGRQLPLWRIMCLGSMQDERGMVKVEVGKLADALAGDLPPGRRAFTERRGGPTRATGRCAKT